MHMAIQICGDSRNEKVNRELRTMQNIFRQKYFLNQLW